MVFNDKNACLPAEDILFMAYSISRWLHLPQLDADKFLRAYDDPDNEGPYILYNENGFLWLDRYYLAYAGWDMNAHYVYIAWHHIVEEVEAVEAAKERTLWFTQKEEITAYFQTPGAFMSQNNTPIWIDPSFLPESAA